jgi:hypothetical protein
MHQIYHGPRLAEDLFDGYVQLDRRAEGEQVIKRVHPDFSPSKQLRHCQIWALAETPSNSRGQ